MENANLQQFFEIGSKYSDDNLNQFTKIPTITKCWFYLPSSLEPILKCEGRKGWFFDVYFYTEYGVGYFCMRFHGNASDTRVTRRETS